MHATGLVEETYISGIQLALCSDGIISGSFFQEVLFFF
jgi:hypothetical protein